MNVDEGIRERERERERERALHARKCIAWAAYADGIF